MRVVEGGGLGVKGGGEGRGRSGHCGGGGRGIPVPQGTILGTAE